MSIESPPTRLLAILRKMGPGMILAGSIVGSGELIATTLTGASAGFSFVWIILIGCVIKVFTQVELARYSISSGKTTLRAFFDVPGGKVIFACWLVMFFAGVGQLGGIVGGVGQALAISVPITESGRAYNDRMAAEMTKLVALHEGTAAREGEAYERARGAIDEEIARIKKDLDPRDALIWCALIAVATSIVLFFGRFGFIEGFCVFMVMLFTFITIGNVVALQAQPDWAVTAARWKADGLMWPRDGGWSGLAVALAAFGIIGVGAAELVGYPYWCLEKGYGRWIGPRDESEAWAERARGWMRIMRFDAWGSMVLYTLSTLAFYILGAAILHRIGLVPEKNEMVRTLSVMYGPVFDTFGQTIFLFGAFAVLFSTFFVANAQKARLLADAIALMGRIDLSEGRRARWVRILSLLFPLACLVVYMFVKKPVVLVLISGVAQSLLLLPLGFAALWYRYRRIDARLRPGLAWDIGLWISFASFGVLAVFLIGQKLGLIES